MNRIVSLLAWVLVTASCLLLVSEPANSQPGNQSDRKTVGIRQAGPPPWPGAADDGARQEVAGNVGAKNFLLIFDGSGSMTEQRCSGSRTKIDVAKEAVIQWAQTVPADANVGLVAFHGKGWSKLPLVAQNRKDLIKVVQAIQPGGTTPLDDAIAQAYVMLTQQGRKQLGYGEYTIVVVTDGIANSPTALRAVVNRVLGYSPIVIYTIGFCIGKNHSLNQEGRTIYKTANNPAALRQGLQEVLAEAETFDVSEFGK
jgi:Ca-activated chloride channel homolog